LFRPGFHPVRSGDCAQIRPCDEQVGHHGTTWLSRGHQVRPPWRRHSRDRSVRGRLCQLLRGLRGDEATFTSASPTTDAGLAEPSSASTPASARAVGTASTHGSNRVAASDQLPRPRLYVPAAARCLCGSANNTSVSAESASTSWTSRKIRMPWNRIQTRPYHWQHEVLHEDNRAPHNLRTGTDAFSGAPAHRGGLCLCPFLSASASTRARGRVVPRVLRDAVRRTRRAWRARSRDGDVCHGRRFPSAP